MKLLRLFAATLATGLIAAGGASAFHPHRAAQGHAVVGVPTAAPLQVVQTTVAAPVFQTQTVRVAPVRATQLFSAPLFQTQLGGSPLVQTQLVANAVLAPAATYQAATYNLVVQDNTGGQEPVRVPPTDPAMVKSLNSLATALKANQTELASLRVATVQHAAALKATKVVVQPAVDPAKVAATSAADAHTETLLRIRTLVREGKEDEALRLLAEKKTQLEEYRKALGFAPNQ